MTTRNSVDSRLSVGVPNSYNTHLFGDSFTDQAGELSEGLGLHTSQYFRLFRNGTGGFRLDQIKTAFDSAFATMAYYVTRIQLQGGINDVAQDRSLTLMQADMAAMADAVIDSGDYGLDIYNLTPFSSSHASYTAARHQKILDYNAWLKTNYGSYVRDIYTALNDTANNGFLDPAYSMSATDLHLNPNGHRKADEICGAFLQQGVDLTRNEKAGNYIVNFDDINTWTTFNNGTIGGTPVKLIDGTESSSKGLINDAVSVAGVLAENIAGGTIPNGTPVTLTALFRAGQYQWVRFSYQDNAGTSRGSYVDILNVELGAQIGSGQTLSVRKLKNGWVELEMKFTMGTGTTTNQINIQPASANTIPVTIPANLNAPSIYVDLTQVVAS